MDNKPETLRDLLGGGHVSLTEVENIARSIFDGEMTAAGPEGYVITACKFDDLPDHVRDFVRKAILSFTVENVFDAAELDEPDEEDELEVSVVLDEADPED